MQQKMITATEKKISSKSVLQFLFWSVMVGLTFYFIVGHAVNYLTNGIPDYFGATLMNTKFGSICILQAVQRLSCWVLCNSGKPFV
jgi:hypothetical protein